jgi:hypothetical protein
MELTPDHKPALARKKDGSFGAAASASSSPSDGNDAVQLNAIDEYAQSIIAKLKSIDLNTVTPMDALTLLYELRKKAVEG